MDDALGQRIVVGITDRADGGIHVGIGQTLGMADRQVLRPAGGVMDQALAPKRFSLPERLVQRIQDELGGHRGGDPPADGEAEPPPVRGPRRTRANTSMTKATWTVPDQVGT